MRGDLSDPETRVDVGDGQRGDMGAARVPDRRHVEPLLVGAGQCAPHRARHPPRADRLQPVLQPGQPHRHVRHRCASPDHRQARPRPELGEARSELVPQFFIAAHTPVCERSTEPFRNRSALRLVELLPQRHAAQHRRQLFAAAQVEAAHPGPPVGGAALRAGSGGADATSSATNSPSRLRSATPAAASSSPLSNRNGSSVSSRDSKNAVTTIALCAAAM